MINIFWSILAGMFGAFLYEYIMDYFDNNS